MKFNKALVLGGGAFSTSMAFVLAENFKEVVIKVRSDENKEQINAGENRIYLPGLTLSKNISAIVDWSELQSDDIDLIISGLPMSAIDDFFKSNQKVIEKILKTGVPLINLAKGIDAQNLKLPDELFLSHFNDFKSQLMYLSGPSFAKEIIEKQITLVSLAGENKELLLKACEMLATDYFKAIPTKDVKGVLLGGALKNVIAIAGGIMEGLGYNHNTRAALITRGIVEMLRFGQVFGAKPETFYGPSGMGDLILTTTGELSRNKSFGIELAKGRTAEEILKSSKSVVEGYKTTEAAYLLAKRMGIRARIFSGLYEVLYEGAETRDVIQQLMKLPPKFEDEI